MIHLRQSLVENDRQQTADYLQIVYRLLYVHNVCNTRQHQTAVSTRQHIHCHQYCCNTVYNCCWCLKTDNVTDNATDNVTEADLIDEANETDEAQIIV